MSNMYECKKEELIKSFTELKNVLEKIQEKTYSSDLIESFQEIIYKIESVICSLKNGKLKIALVGAVSDGKTSTVAGYLGYSDESMKIADEESSDEIIEYEPKIYGEKVTPCVFVDTPGLFGRKYSSKTEKYISEAHIVMFVVSAINPLKESHRDTVKYLLAKLKKFDNTIFIINVMDKVCDYTDDEDFKEKAQTKMEYLRENVAEFLNISVEDQLIKNMNIVCIAADPDGNGLIDDVNRGKTNYWLREENIEKYEKYSKMPILRTVVNNVVSNTISEKLLEEVALDSIKQEVAIILERLKLESEILVNRVVPETEHLLKTLESDVTEAKKNLKKEIRPFTDEIKSLEKEICFAIENAMPDTLIQVIDDYIGGGEEPGYKLNLAIQNIVIDHFEGIITETCNKIETDFENTSQNIDNLFSKVGNGAKGIGNAAKGVNKGMVKSARDFLSKYGIKIKFKPYGMEKLTKFINKGIPIIGTAVSLITDCVSLFLKNKELKKFNDNKKKIENSIKDYFKAIYDNLNLSKDTFFNTFAPEIIEMEKQIEQTRLEIKEQKNINKFFIEKQKEIECIEYIS